MDTAVVGLGSNIGDAAANVLGAVEALATLPHSQVAAVSRLYRTPAWGGVAQADFVNAAVRLETALAPLDLLDGLLEIERRFGRVRTAGNHWGPRTLDLDVLLYGTRVIAHPRLTVPHPYLHERAFALVPLLDVLPSARIPGRGDARKLLQELHETGAIAPIG